MKGSLFMVFLSCAILSNAEPNAKPVALSTTLIKSNAVKSAVKTIKFQKFFQHPYHGVFCPSDDSSQIGDNVNNYGNLWNYGARSYVAYCDYEGNIQGYLVIHAYVDAALCQATYFYDVESITQPTTFRLVITYNGVGTIFTDAQLVPRFNNIYSVAGNWTVTTDSYQNKQYTITGGGDYVGPYYVDYSNSYTCGTAYAGLVGTQIAVAFIQTCDFFGNPTGLIDNSVAYLQQDCLGKQFTGAQAYSDIDPNTGSGSLLLNIYYD